MKKAIAYLGLVFCALTSCSLGTERPQVAGAAGVGGADASAGDAGAPENSAGQAGEGARISGPPPAGGVFVHLFEWRWPDIALECEHYLGPAGFAAVQVSPPNEHALIAAAGYPWWQRYQPVSYSLARSRSGSAAEFKDMVQRCARVGVGIYVDAVFNHCTGLSAGTGSNGTAFTKYQYPGLYTAADFHQPPCSIRGSDYVNMPDRVRTCELSGLSDLRTEDDSVRDKIAGYLNALTDLGVAGFRVDAGKHMYPADLDAIVSRVNQHVGSAPAPFFFLEVIDGGGNDAIHMKDYTSVGAGSGEAVSLSDFQYASLFDRFLNRNGGRLSSFSFLVGSTRALPSGQAVVFTTNHDTERATPAAISYKDGKLYDLATVFLLAWPYGYPSLMSSFAFDDFDLGPPSDAAGHTLPLYKPGSSTPDCASDPATAAPGSWVCQHREPFIAGLIAFRKATLGAEEITNFWDDGRNRIAFGRGTKGFVVINLEDTAVSQEFTTDLPAGRYCDVYAGDAQRGACTGATVTVDAQGTASISVEAYSAVVLHVGKRL